MNRLAFPALAVMIPLACITGCRTPTPLLRTTFESSDVPIPDKEGIIELYEQGFGLSRECYYDIEAVTELYGEIHASAAMECHIHGYDTLLLFTGPKRLRETAVLRKGNQLWLWRRNTDRQTQPRPMSPRTCARLLNIGPLVQIIGTPWRKLFHVERVQDESVYGRDCYVLDLTATGNSVFFERAKVWIDKETELPVAQDFLCYEELLLYHATFEFNLRSDGHDKKPSLEKITVELVDSGWLYTYTFSDYNTDVKPIAWDDFLFQDR